MDAHIGVHGGEDKANSGSNNKRDRGGGAAYTEQQVVAATMESISWPLLLLWINRHAETYARIWDT